MSTFKDALGREWTIAKITVGQVRKVREKTSLDLADPLVGNTLDKLRDDPCSLVDCLYVLCDDSHSKHALKAEQWAEAFWGDAIVESRRALEVALLDFFPSDKRAAAKLLMDVITAQEKAAPEKAARIGQRFVELLQNLESTPTPTAPES